MASIEKRTNGKGETTYRVKVRLKGYPAQTETFNRLTDARKWATQTEAALRERRHFKTAEAEKHSFAELIERYIRDILPTKPKARNQGQQLRWWKQELGSYSLAEITPSLLSEARDKLSKRTSKTGRVISPATVVRYMAALSHALSIASKEWEWLEANPMQKVRKPKEPRGRIRFLSEDEQDPEGQKVEGERTRLLKACRESESPILYTVVVLALSTGMRQGEIMGLTWQVVDLNRGRITLHDTKNNERRVVPLTGKALELLKEHSKIRHIGGTSLVFPGKNPERPVELRKPWMASMEAADVEGFRFHDLRHSAASYLAMNGASLAEIAEVLGHKTLQMVKRYAHLSEAHTAGVISRLDDRMFGEDR